MGIRRGGGDAKPVRTGAVFYDFQAALKAPEEVEELHPRPPCSDLTGISTLTRLRVLKLDDPLLGIDSIPEEIGALKYLQTLQVVFQRRLTALPASTGDLAALEELTIGGTGLTSLPAEIHRLDGLRRVVFWNNGRRGHRRGEDSVADLWPSLSLEQILGLRDVRFSPALLARLPPVHDGFRQVERAEANEVTLSADIGPCPRLREVSLLRTPDLGVTLETLAGCPALRRVKATTHDTTLPASVGLLQQVRTLILDMDRLTTVPPELGNLASLEQLDLHAPALRTLPDETGGLVGLRVALLRAGLDAVPATIGSWTKLETLELGTMSSGVHRRPLPADLWTLPSLRELALMGSELPPEVRHLRKLTDLRVCSGSLESLPAEIGKLAHLEHLRVQAPRCGSLPSSLGDLERLHTLVIEATDLTEVPPSLGRLTSLRELRLHAHGLTHLPSALSDLEQLELLAIRVDPDTFAPDHPSAPLSAAIPPGLRLAVFLGVDEETSLAALAPAVGLQWVTAGNGRGGMKDGGTLRTMPDTIGAWSDLEVLSCHRKVGARARRTVAAQLPGGHWKRYASLFTYYDRGPDAPDPESGSDRFLELFKRSLLHALHHTGWSDRLMD